MPPVWSPDQREPDYENIFVESCGKLQAEIGRWSGDQTAALTDVGVGFRTDEGTPTAAENLPFFLVEFQTFKTMKLPASKI